MVLRSRLPHSDPRNIVLTDGSHIKGSPTQVVQSIETASRLMVARGWEGRKCSMGSGSPLGRWDVLEPDRGDGVTTL